MLTRPTDDPGHARLQEIAQASIQLAALVPKMAAVAESMERQAQEQAQSASEASTTVAALVVELETAVRELRASSSQMETALLTVRRIADHTKILSINASIEAARAGEAGRAFSVVVDEVKQLAETTKEATQTIESEIGGMQSRVGRVSAVAGLGDSASGTTIGAVNHRVSGMAGSARQQLESAQSLYEMGNRVEGLAENMLLSVGTFRFEAHAEARQALDEILPTLRAAGLEKHRVEQCLRDLLADRDYLELAYATDGQGRQFVDNLVRRGGGVVHDAAACGRVWTDRPWYQEAIRADEVTATDIYRSQATRDFCFTVAAAWRNREGRVVGVVAADVNFHRLLRQKN